METPSDTDHSPARAVDMVLEAIRHAVSSGVGAGHAQLPHQLAEADFSPSALGARQDADPSWWNLERRGASFVDVDFSNRDLHRVNMYRADLRRASFDGAKAQEIDFRSTCLSDASLQDADLRFANLTTADLRGADLDRADLWRAGMGKADLSEASLRDVRMAGATLEAATLDRVNATGADFEGAILGGASLRDATAPRSNFRDADLDGAQLQGGMFFGADFSGARLRGADLSGASLGSVSFRNAILKNAVLRDLQLSDCDMTGAFLAGAKLEGAEIAQRQLGGKVGEELERDYEGARRAYRGLRQAFEALGDDRAASWAYRRMQRMQRRQHKAAAVAAWKRKDLGVALVEGTRSIRDLFVEWTCDYGDSVGRVMLSLLAVFVVFGVIYGVTGSVVSTAAAGGPPVVIRSPYRVSVFALTALLTGGNPGDLQPRNDFAQILIGSQAFLGIALTGLLGFVVGTKIRRS